MSFLVYKLSAAFMYFAHRSIPHTAVVLSLYLILTTSWTVLVDHFGYCLSVFDPKGVAQQAQTAIQSPS